MTTCHVPGPIRVPGDEAATYGPLPGRAQPNGGQQEEPAAGGRDAVIKAGVGLGITEQHVAGGDS